MADNQIRIVVTASGAEAASKVLADIAKSGASIGSIVSPAIKKADDALNDFGGTAKRVFEIFTGINLASIFQQATVAVRDFVVESSKLGREQQLQEATFKSFATSVGVAGEVLAAQIDKAAGGIIDSGEAMKIAMRGLSAGLQPEQIVTLTDAARQLAKSLGVDTVEAYQSLTEAIATGRSRRLQEIGITVDLESALESYAASIGKTVKELDTAGRTQALYLATMKEAKPVIEANRQVNDEFGDSMKRLKIAWDDVRETFGVFINETAVQILTWLKQVKEDVGAIGPSLTELGTIWVTTWTNAAAALAPLAGADGGLFQIKTLVNNVMLALAESAAIINQQILLYTQWSGAIHFVALALKDLASGQLPDLAAHTATVTKRVEDATKAYADSQETLKRLVASFKDGGTAADEFGQGWGRAAGSLSAGRNALGEIGKQVKALTPDMKAAAAEAAKMADAILKGHVAAAEATIAETEQGLKLELELTNKRLAEEAKLLEQGTAGWIAHADAVEQNRLDQLAGELKLTNDRLAEEKKALDDTNAGWVAHAEAVLAGTEASLNATAKANEPLRAYHDTLERINLQAKLFGPSFDALPPTIAAVTAEIVRLGAAGQDVTALQEKLAGLKQVQELKGIFADVFSSIGSAISTSIQGVILGTQTLGQAWDKLWKSIVLSFVNSGIQRILKGLTDWALDFFFGGSGGGGGGGGGFFGTLLSGAGSLLNKFFGGGGGANFTPVGPGDLLDFTPVEQAFTAVTDTVSGTTKAFDLVNPGISNFSAGLGLATSALGAGLGIYGLTKGGSAGSMALSAVGTTASLYGIAQSASVLAANSGLISTALPTIGVGIAKGIAALAPSFAASIGTTLSSILPETIVTALGGVVGPGLGVTIAQGIASVAPSLAATIGTTLSAVLPETIVAALTSTTVPVTVATTGAGAGAGIGAGIGAGAGSAAAWLLNPGVAFGAFLLQGGLMGKQADAEATARAFKESAAAITKITQQMNIVGGLFGNTGQALSTANLPATLAFLNSTLRDVANLGLIIQTSFDLPIQEGDKLTKEITGARAKLGSVWLAALDAAKAQGLAAPGSPFRMTEGMGGIGDIFTGFSNDVAISGQLMAHALDLTVAEMQELRGAMAGVTDGTMTWATIMERAVNEPGGILAKAFGPERLPILAERLGLSDTGAIDPSKINALLDKGWLTATLHDAVVDIGASLGVSIEKLAAAGIAPGVWQQLAGGNVYGGGINTGAEGLPSVAAMAELQTRLEAAGFTPGNYGKALEAFLVSVDANVVNHPRWAEFTNSLQAADAAGGILPGVVGGPIATPQGFRGAAEAIIASLNAQIAEQAKARRGATDAEAITAIDQTLEVLGAQLKAWTEGFRHLYAIASDVSAQLPPNLEGQFREAVRPAYEGLLVAMRSGSAEQASVAANFYAEQINAWGAFAQAVKSAVSVETLLPADLPTQMRAAMMPAYDAVLNALKTGTAAQAKIQTDAFAQQLQAWSAFGEAVTQAISVDALMPDNLGDRFHAAMQPEYDKILASLVAGNAAVAQIQIQHFAKLTAAWAAFGGTTIKAIDVDALLPADLGDKFRARMQPEYDKILAALVAGNAEVASVLIDKFNKQLAAWASIGDTVTRITGELAGLTGNFEVTAESWVAVQRQMDGAVTRAQAAFDKALASGDVEQIARTAALLHDATMTRLEAELAMVKQIEDAIAATLQSASGLVELVTTIATMEITMGAGIGTIQALLGSLEGMATSGSTAAQRLWAVQAGLEAIVAVLPGLIEKTASFATALEWLTKGMQTAEQLRAGPAGAGAITGAVLAGAGPFLTALQGLIDAATGSGKLALLQTQAGQFQALAAAAIAGINQWAQAAIAGARAAAAEVIKGARDEADRRIGVARTEAARRQALIDAAREKALAAIDAEIEAAETAARLGQEARRAQIEALQELIAKSREWEAAVESMGKFIQSLKVGPLGPGNPADKLAQAQDAFSKALAAYNANPTAAGLTDLQALAQTLLGLAEPIFSKPSPQFQALSANILKQLEAAQALAAAQVTDSAVLQAQLDQLIAMDKAATLAAGVLLDGLRVNREAIVKDFEKQTKDLSDALDKYIGEIEEALKTYIGNVETALETQIKAIEKAAKDEIDAINIGLIGALKKNAEEQAGLLGEEAKKIDRLIAALTSSEFGANLGDIATYAAQRQDVAIGILEAIKRGISLAVGQPLARGSERVTEGLYHLHDDEAVLPKTLAERFRAAGGFDQMIRSAAFGAGLEKDTPFDDPVLRRQGRHDPTTPAFLFSGPHAAALNQLQAIIEMLEGRLAADLVRNTYTRGGKTYQRRTDAELEALKGRVAEQVAELRRQQQALIDSIPPPGPPPKVKPPPGTPPPYIPPGPGWLTRGGGDVNPNMANLGGGMVSGPTTIIVKLDGKTIGEATLPTIHGDARGGKLRTIFLETRPK